MKSFKYSSLILILTLILCQYDSVLYAQSSSVTRSPTIASNNTAVGSNSWSNPNNVFANDNTLTSLSTKGVTHYIASSGYGFSIPSPANITGISVEVLRGASGVQNVSLLNSWTNGLTKTVSAGVNRCLIVVVALETGTDLREVSSMTYGGQAMTQLANVASVSGFYARLQVWALTETGIAAATSTTISPVYSGTLHAEYCENFSAASFANVDQYSLSSHTVESYLNSPPSATYQLEGPLSTLTGKYVDRSRDDR